MKSEICDKCGSDVHKSDACPTPICTTNLIHSLRTQLKSVEADNAAMVQVIECAGSHDHSDGDEKDCVLCQAVNSVLDHPHPGKSLLLLLREAEWLIRNAGEPSWRLGYTESNDWLTRRDAFLNPKPQDVM